MNFIRNACYFFLTFGAFGFAVSCKKENEKKPEPVVGNWTLVELGRDFNSNNSVDSGETDAASQSRINWILYINDNNSYNQKSNAFGDKNGAWTLTNSNFTTVAAADTINYQVQSVTASKLVLLRKNSQSMNQWYIFDK